MDFYKGQQAVIATMHSKESVIAPLLESELGITTTTLNSLNTNKFGTFTRTIKRKGSQLDAATAKANAAIELSDCNIAISSEGSFGPVANIPLIPNNIELVLFLDPANNLTVKGVHSNHKVLHKGTYAHSIDEALQIAKDYDFPNHGIVLRKSETSRKILSEELTTLQELKDYLQSYFKKPFTKKIYIETDMRAHRNPTRMANIELATKDLIAKLKNKCPKCDLPGFGLNGYQYGLECKLCGAPTKQKKTAILYCSACKYEELQEIDPTKKADPSHCNFCNP